MRFNIGDPVITTLGDTGHVMHLFEHPEGCAPLFVVAVSGGGWWLGSDVEEWL